MDILLFIIISGISGKSQFLLALVFSTRYLDLFTHFVSPYNTLMKIFFLTISWATVHLIYGKFKSTYLQLSDSFRVELLVIPCAGLACLVNHDYSALEVSRRSNSLATACLTDCKIIHFDCYTDILDFLYVFGGRRDPTSALHD